jgi:hypothetical protein
MITNFFHPPGDGLLQYTYIDFQPYLEDYPFEHLQLLFHKDSQPSSCLNFDGHEDMASSEQLEIHVLRQ